MRGLCAKRFDYSCCTWIHNTSEEVSDYPELIEKHHEQVNYKRDGNPLKGLSDWIPNLAGWVKQLIMLGILILVTGMMGLLLYAVWTMCCKDCLVDGKNER